MCGAGSICKGLVDTYPTFSTYTCSCPVGLVSPTANGKNCFKNCTSNTNCGGNSTCNLANGNCIPNQGYYSPTADGTNAVLMPLNSKCS